MADRIEWFDIVIPANTPVNNLHVANLSFKQATVLEIDVIVPPGPAGNVGFYLTAGGSQALPRTPGSFIISDDQFFQWQTSNYINSGQWGMAGYNLDFQDHTIQVGFQLNEIVYSPTSSFGSPVSV